MLKYTLKRLLMMIPVLLGVSFVVFLLMYISPGDPAKMILGEMAEKGEIEALRETLGLNAGFWERYFNYMKDILLYGDLGISYVTREPVISEVMERFPVTLRLASSGVLVSLCIGVPCGIIAATKQYSVFDHVATLLSLLGNAMPAFWMGILLILIFSVQLGWLPSSGYTSIEYMILPALTLALAMSAKYTRQVRSAVLEELHQDYVTGARMRGIKESVILWKHVLPNVMLPLVTLLGLSLGSLLGGTAVVEIIYNWPGMGNMAVKAISCRDYPLVQGYVLWIAILYMCINLLVDLSYTYLDPRLKEDR